MAPYVVSGDCQPPTGLHSRPRGHLDDDGRTAADLIDSRQQVRIGRCHDDHIAHAAQRQRHDVDREFDIDALLERRCSRPATRVAQQSRIHSDPGTRPCLRLADIRPVAAGLPRAVGAPCVDPHVAQFAIRVPAHNQFGCGPGPELPVPQRIGALVKEGAPGAPVEVLSVEENNYPANVVPIPLLTRNNKPATAPCGAGRAGLSQ